MKIYNDVGCSTAVEESELEKFINQGWMIEETYKRLHPEEFNQ